MTSVPFLLLSLGLVTLGLVTGVSLSPPAKADTNRAESSAGPPVQKPPMVILAPASMTDAMTAIRETYQHTTGTQLQISYAATSQNARLLAAGAPAHVFISAHPMWITYLQEARLLKPGSTVTIAHTRLAVIAPGTKTGVGAGNNSARSPQPDRPLKVTLLQARRLAVADPAAVPAGLYAREALMHLGLWDALSPRLIPLQNVRVALATTARAETDMAIVYEADARRFHQHVHIVGLFPENSHQPILYQSAISHHHSHPDAVTFTHFITSPDGQQHMTANGFRHVD